MVKLTRAEGGLYSESIGTCSNPMLFITYLEVLLLCFSLLLSLYIYIYMCVYHLQVLILFHYFVYRCFRAFSSIFI